MEAKCWCQVEEAGGCCSSAGWAAVRAQAPGASTAVEVRLARLFLKALAHCACASTPVGGDQWSIVSGVFRVYTLHLQTKVLFSVLFICIFCLCVCVPALGVFVCVPTCLYVHCLHAGACRDQKREADLPELELQLVASHWVWVLRTELNCPLSEQCHLNY